MPAGTAWADAAVAVGLASSKSEANRLVKQGGARVWQEKVTDAGAVVEASAVLWAGKKKAALVVVEPARLGD